MTKVTSNPLARQHSARGQGSKLTKSMPSNTSSAQVASSSPPKPAHVPEKAATLEQSVRKFRVVEALRNGDTSAISKAIRETADNGPRPSTSSVNTVSSGPLDDTTVLHLAIQCAEHPVIEYVLSEGAGIVDVNSRDKDGNTPMHVAAVQGRTPVVKLLLDQSDINDAIANAQGKLPIDLARNPDIFQLLQLSRSLYTEAKIKQVQELVHRGDYDTLAQVLEEPRLRTVIDINSPEFASEPATVQSGGTLLHEAARRKNTQLIQVLLLHGGDPFRRDRKGKLPQSITNDDGVKAILKKSPAAVAAQRGIQEKAVLGHAASQGNVSAAGPGDLAAGREAREIKGYLKKWTNYRKGYQLRWFVLEDGVLSYYKHQDDAGSACRGAINMKIARLHMSPDEKTKFEIIGKSSVKYTLKANHEVEAKRWFWALNNSIQWTKDQAREEERQASRSAEMLKVAKDHQSSLSVQDTQSENASLSDMHRTTSQAISRTASHAKLASISKGDFAGTSTVGSVDDDDFADAATDGGASRGPANGGVVIPGELDDDDDRSVRGQPGATKDALNITAQSAKLQLETMSNVQAALMAEMSQSPATPLSDTKVTQALSTYDAAIRSLTGLVGDLLRISKDRDAHWQYRLDRETGLRRMWEDSMQQVAREQEELEARVGEAEEKRRLTKKALREVMEAGGVASAGNTPTAEVTKEAAEVGIVTSSSRSLARRGTALDQLGELSESESGGEEDEFFDAVDAGEVELAAIPYGSLATAQNSAVDSGRDISTSFKGYENGIRHRLKMDADDRPKISLWVCLQKASMSRQANQIVLIYRVFSSQ